MKLAAVMMVRNEAPIIADSIGHLLHGVGVDQIYVADNDSNDNTMAILRRIAALDPRVQVRAAPGAFSQPETMRNLLQEAMAGGADWLLPNDADEFLWMSKRFIHRLCKSAGTLGGFRLRVRNFAQLRSVTRDRAGAIETMAFRAAMAGSEQKAQSLVSQAGLPFLRMRYPSKLLLRASAPLSLGRGQHEAFGLAGHLAPKPIGDLLHAPIRSRDDLHTRVSHGLRSMEVSPDPAVSWHLKRLVGMDCAALDAEWRINSIDPRWPLRPGFRIDLRLCWLGRRMRAFRQQVLASDRSRSYTTVPASAVPLAAAATARAGVVLPGSSPPALRASRAHVGEASSEMAATVRNAAL